MKNILLKILMFVMALTLSACSFMKVGWVVINLPGSVSASYILFTGTESSRVDLAEGETLILNYDATVHYGKLSIAIDDPGGNQIWQTSVKNDKNAKVEITAPELGQYKIIITGQNTGGDFALSWTSAMTHSPKQVVDEFYNWYLRYVTNGAGSGNALSARAYRSSDLLMPEFITKVDTILETSEINGPGYDPFLCAQNVPPSLAVDDVVVSGDAATVWISYQSLSFTASLTRFADDWKITDIKCSFE